jgi:hypothetical protein
MFRAVPDAVPAAIEPTIPYARSVIALERGDFETIRRTVAALFRVAHGEAFQRRADAEPGAGPVVRHRPAHHAVFMGYDFHLGANGPRLIEVNTNAGGALLNGLHTAALCPPPQLSCLCAELLPVEAMRRRILATFAAEQEAARPGVPLARVAIADERPAAQFLRAEFELFRALFADAGIDAVVCDVAELAYAPGAGLRVAGAAHPLDLVYLRDTDWRLEAPRSAALRAAYLAGAAVVTPAPREHHLLAHKGRLAWLSSPETLAELGASAEDAALLARVVPETHALATLGVEAAWRTREEWVFKPESAFASRAVYRGDKISRRKLEEIAAAGGFVAQRRVEPGEVTVVTGEGPRRMKFDVRAYAYRDEVLLLGARAYQGQVTNLRTPGGGFSAICVVRGAAGEAAR